MIVRSPDNYKLTSEQSSWLDIIIDFVKGFAQPNRYLCPDWYEYYHFYYDSFHHKISLQTENSPVIVTLLAISKSTQIKHFSNKE